MSSLRRVVAARLVALFAVLGSLLVPVAPASAAPGEWVITTPGSAVAARVTLDPGAGGLALAVSRQGRTVLAPSPIGLRAAEVDLTGGLRAVGRTDRLVTERYAMTTGKRLQRQTRMTETTLAFTGAGGARLDLVVRVAPDGVAYRYAVPDPVTVTGEASSFRLPADAPAWLLPYNAWYEANRVRTTAAGAAEGEYGHPSLFRVGEDYALITESDVDGRYPGGRLRHAAGSGDYRVVLADEQVAGVTRTPWRVAIVGSLATVGESTLVDDLASPSKVADTSWVRPGKVAWSWLSEHASPGDFERQKRYVDFAARHGWEYVLVDEGWRATWVPELVRHARAKGVEVLLWFHWTALDTQAERDTVLPEVRRWGVRGVKLDFMESDSRARYQWYDAVLAKTAELRLMVNFHGSTIPHGLARTWPHVMTMEAVRGAENSPPAANNPVQAFTRNAVGSMDYTPVSLEVGPKEASVAHEVALPVLYESGWTHFADKPEAYERFPEALRYLDQVPTAWDETRVLGGDPSDHAVVARRSGDRWFVGAVAAGDPRTLRAPLGFLGGGQWLVEVVRDGEGRGDVRRDARIARSSAALEVAVPRDGGFAAVICPYRPGTLTCDRPVMPVPATTLAVAPSGVVDAAKGSTFEVTGSFTAEAAIEDVVLTAAAPEGWTVTGAPVTRRALRPGEALTGRWTVRVGEDSPVGAVDVPVSAEFRAPGHARVHVEQAVRAFVPPPVPTGEPYVSDLPFMSEGNGWGPVERDRSNGENAGGDGNPLTIGGVVHAKGVGVHAPSDLSVYLGGGCRELTAVIGLDDETAEPGSVVFQVFGDDRLLYDSGVLRGGDPARPITVDTTGVRMVGLRVTDGGDGRNFDHADWAEARLACA
ncbi:glycoside hydrolase family 97 catalytic domain-containing protein [Saccharothrix texasensis]|uniref:Alpha-galactosidase-like protein n=1 Tax=Saccharothrix texasensis TaxID=103734 RepID=A0A3N1GXV5_9PSEU|nr:glycoside hydrolase family 97 catalytic domain-containing protein [Saccharothrix texasensis]ROP35161.1 alpha-galactosidase-like protein [Saccharothrix texasensis]